ncbi:hypothetical protein PGT21_003694 [Puccinia graminis f. sp. tritici]|uniref:Uncharacterized protein n=1 Tax=Puccinia graminis f. sp. tritici TaxID=56615 RepID=A0A5B0QM38_PUCGR|nr:hypothetical protein PGT21_003694 [Puccinia graminis f. sp. tritici]
MFYHGILIMFCSISAAVDAMDISPLRSVEESRNSGNSWFDRFDPFDEVNSHVSAGTPSSHSSLTEDKNELMTHSVPTAQGFQNKVFVPQMLTEEERTIMTQNWDKNNNMLNILYEDSRKLMTLLGIAEDGVNSFLEGNYNKITEQKFKEILNFLERCHGYLKTLKQIRLFELAEFNAKGSSYEILKTLIEKLPEQVKLLQDITPEHAPLIMRIVYKEYSKNIENEINTKISDYKSLYNQSNIEGQLTINGTIEFLHYMIQFMYKNEFISK